MNLALMFMKIFTEVMDRRTDKVTSQAPVGAKKLSRKSVEVSLYFLS